MLKYIDPDSDLDGGSPQTMPNLRVVDAESADGGTDGGQDYPDVIYFQPQTILFQRHRAHGVLPSHMPVQLPGCEKLDD